MNLELDPEAHALFLDFDGTLVPIVDRPEHVAIADATLNALDRLLARMSGAVAIISGRALADIRPLLNPIDIPIAGSHGAEFHRPSRGMSGLRGEPEELGDAILRLREFANRNDLLFERKRGAATIHYRARPELSATSRCIVDRLAAGSDRLRAMHGDMVSEVVLNGVDKGTALEKFLHEPPFAGRLPISVGDDATDEFAFHAAQQRGGVGVKVGSGPTSAKLRAPSIDAFLSWLHSQVPQS